MRCCRGSVASRAQLWYYLDDLVALAQAGHLGRRSRIDLADELAGPILLGMQVKAVAVKVRPFDNVAEPGAGSHLTHDNPITIGDHCRRSLLGDHWTITKDVQRRL